MLRKWLSSPSGPHSMHSATDRRVGIARSRPASRTRLSQPVWPEMYKKSKTFFHIDELYRGAVDGQLKAMRLAAGLEADCPPGKP